MNVHSLLKYFYICTEIIKNYILGKKDKREAILNAALSLITSYGFHGTSMKMIAESANIAAGTIYIYFSSKEEMIAALYQEIGDEINQIIINNNNETLYFSDNFITIWMAILEFYIDDPRKPEFITQYAYSPYITNNKAYSQDTLLAPVYSIFEKAKECKVVKDLSIIALISLSHSPITSLVRMTKYEQLELENVEVKKIAQACWDAIKLND